MLEVLQDRIEQGVYPLGKRLPSERKLADEFKVPQSQIHKKLRQLVDAGLLECYRGNGYFIRSGRPSSVKLYRVALCGNPRGSTQEKENFYVGVLLSLAPEYKLNITWYTMPKEERAQEELISYLIHERIDGIFCYPHFIKGFLPAFSELIQRQIPLIFWDYSPFPGIFPSIGVDHFRSCMRAAEILSKQKRPVTYVGFTGAEQNRLKYQGFKLGCQLFNVTIEDEIFFPYRDVLNAEKLNFTGKLGPGRLYFTSTRLLSSRLIGTMFDSGFLPGRDYHILTVDRVKFMDDSLLQLDTMMRNNTSLAHKLLSEMSHAITKPPQQCNDWRIVMDYIAGRSLAPVTDER